MKTVLVVDDEPKIVDVVREYLEHAGFSVRTAGDGPAALERARALAPDLIVLDLGLPGLDGLDVARQLRRSSRVPVIILTARGDEVDRIIGLEIGADDYLVKPFSPRELVARVRAVLRRVDERDMAADDEALVRGDVVVDPARRRVTVADRAVELTPTEFDLLAHLATRPGHVFTRGQLLDQVWGYGDGSGARTVDSHVRSLRRKLGPDIVRTVHGVGYAAGGEDVTADTASEGGGNER